MEESITQTVSGAPAPGDGIAQRTLVGQIQPAISNGIIAPVPASAAMRNAPERTGKLSPTKRSPKVDVPLLDRAAFMPNEFAALFGKSITWSYRMLYAGKVRAITSLGRVMIPASEVKRLQCEAVTYSGKAKGGGGKA